MKIELLMTLLLICIQAMTTLVLIDEKRMCLSAAGLFKVGAHLIPAVSLLYHTFFEPFYILIMLICLE